MSAILRKNQKKIYIIGIKGSGIVALAEIFHAEGMTVVGSDVDEVFFTDEILKKLKIKCYEGFNEENIKKEMPVDLIVRSTAYNEENNDEVAFAKKQGINIVMYPQIVGELIKSHFSIAVCGTHGKTTITAMLSLAMRSAGADPTAIIGSKVKQLKSSLMIGKSKYFVVEADEYQNKLAMYDPLGVVFTSADYDHPDFFKTPEQYKEVFIDFIEKIPTHGFLVAWGEDAGVVEIAKKARCKIIFYGQFLQERVESDLRRECEGTNFEIVKTPEKLSPTIPGKHNILNATAALAVSRQLKLDEEIVISSLNEFQGTSRRFEFIGRSNGAIIIDDYAHHPEEVKATLLATKEKYTDKKIICVFHPQTFSRTKALLDDFAQSFGNANETIILDIYGSARENGGDVHSKDLVEKIEKYGQQVEYISTIEECFVYLKDRIDQNDVVITMGAGNVWELGPMLIKGEITV